MWTKVYFDISQAAENFETVDNMTLWIKDKDGNKANAEYSLSVSGIDSYKKDMSKFTRFVLIIVCVVSTILSVVCIVAVIKVLIIRRKKRKRWEMEEEAIQENKVKDYEIKRKNDFRRHISNADFSENGENVSGQKALKLRIENIRDTEKGKRSHK